MRDLLVNRGYSERFTMASSLDVSQMKRLDTQFLDFSVYLCLYLLPLRPIYTNEVHPSITIIVYHSRHILIQDESSRSSRPFMQFLSGIRNSLRPCFLLSSTLRIAANGAKCLPRAEQDD